jgi:biotin synthase-like enzyme
MTNNKQIFLCAINNILSGTCQEDCKFCTQSVRYHADIERYSYKDISTIVKEAKLAKEHGALGYCLVTAGKGLDDKTKNMELTVTTITWKLRNATTQIFVRHMPGVNVMKPVKMSNL